MWSGIGGVDVVGVREQEAHITTAITSHLVGPIANSAMSPPMVPA